MLWENVLKRHDSRRCCVGFLYICKPVKFRVMQKILQFLHASSSWVDQHLGWFLTNGNKQVHSVDTHSDGGVAEF
jgi:hypothetical protein